MKNHVDHKRATRKLNLLSLVNRLPHAVTYSVVVACLLCVAALELRANDYAVAFSTSTAIPYISLMHTATGDTNIDFNDKTGLGEATPHVGSPRGFSDGRYESGDPSCHLKASGLNPCSRIHENPPRTIGTIISDHSHDGGKFQPPAPTTVPEPPTATLTLAGVFGLAILRVRRGVARRSSWRLPKTLRETDHGRRTRSRL